MSFSFVAEIYKRFIVGSLKNTEEIPDVDEWMQFLDGLPEPFDEIDRSFNKFLCRKWFIPKGKLALLNIASFVYLILAVPRLIKSKEVLSRPHSDSLVIMKDDSVQTDDILPSALVERFSSVKEVEKPSFKNGCLCMEAAEIFFDCVKRHPMSFYFLLFVLKELSIHSTLLASYDAKAVAVYVAERNVATPLLRKIYEESEREFDSFMHGEYLLQMIQAYSSFSNFYVWDENYISMFESLRFHCGGFEVYTPEKLRKKWNLEEIEPDHFCTYYFSGESEKTIRNIAALFAQLEKQGKGCSVRPHPRYSHVELIKLCFRPDQIEDPLKVSVRESMGAAEYVVGLTSTILSEAYAEEKKIVLDDLSDKEMFESLKSRKSPLLDKDHILFSDLIEQCACEGDKHV